LKKALPKADLIFTIGHSTREIEDFLLLLKEHAIKLLVDVRTIPKSRHNPQFNSEAIEKALREKGLDYVHMKGLGGLRHPKNDSPNTAWRTPSFRGYADYMQTDDFRENLAKLVVCAGKQRTVIMCAEAVPWRCHRSLIGDALLVRGIKVVHIISKDSLRDHTLTPWAKVDGLSIIYPA
jgi:uncharacterized protein (DUF488 family)